MKAEIHEKVSPNYDLSKIRQMFYNNLGSIINVVISKNKAQKTVILDSANSVVAKEPNCFAPAVPDGVNPYTLYRIISSLVI